MIHLMRQIAFNRITTSSLGFGCSALARHYSRKQALRTMEVAFDNGVTHFDVAPAYGFGMAEQLLGTFSEGKRDHVTITSKFGLQSKKFFTKNLFLLNTARSIIAASGKFNRRIVQHTGGANTKEQLTAHSAEGSIHQSLRDLKTDYLDFFLLHECTVDEANSEEMLRFVENIMTAGKVRYMGLATHFSNMTDAAALNDKYSVLQYNSSILQPNKVELISRQALHIHYNIISHPKNAAVRIPLNEMLYNAAMYNKEGICLFTSTHIKNIQANVKTWNEIKL